MASELRQSFDLDDGAVDAYHQIRGDLRASQNFTPAISHAIDQVDLYFQKTGTPGGTLTIEIKAVDGNSKPTSTALATGTIAASAITTAGWYTIALTATGTGTNSLVSGTKYNIQGDLSAAGDGSNYIGWAQDASSPAYTGGEKVQSTDNGSTWTVVSTTDMFFKEYGAVSVSAVTPADKTYSRKLIAIAGNQLWYESSAGTMAQLAASKNDLDVSVPLTAVEAYQKVFIANGTNLKVADFVNTKLSTADIVGAGVIPTHGMTLTGSSSGATIIVDFITAATSAAYVYGKRTSVATFTSSDTLADADTTVSVALNANEVAGPHWYTWTAYANSTVYGVIPTYATVVTKYRGRLYLTADKYSPHQWYMSRQGNPWDFAYTAVDVQSPVAGGTGDVGEVGDLQIAAIPYGDDFLVMGCASSMWLLAGDPMEGGSLDPISENTGIFGPHAYCWDDAGSLYHWGTNGIYKTTVPGAPQCISQVRLPGIVATEGVDPSTHRIVLAYDKDQIGILVFITKLSDGTNSNYFYDLRTNGFFPDAYPTACSVFSAYHYDAVDDTYRKLMLGSYDGFIRYFNPSKKSDVGTSADVAINSYVKFGPVPLSQSPDRQGVISGLNLVSAGGGVTGGSQSDSNDVSFSVFTAKSAEEAIEKLYANTGPNFAGTFYAPGVRMGGIRNQKAKGAYLGIRLYNDTLAQSWGFEKMYGSVKQSGRIK